MTESNSEIAPAEPSQHNLGVNSQYLDACTDSRCACDAHACRRMFYLHMAMCTSMYAYVCTHEKTDCMAVCVRLYLHVHWYVSTYLHNVCMCACMHACMQECVHRYLPTYLHIYLHHIHTYTHTYIRADTLTNRTTGQDKTGRDGTGHTHTYKHTNTCIHAYIHTHT